MRRRTLALTVATATLAMVGAVLATQADAAEAGCNPSDNGSSSAASCHGGERIKWRLVVDCFDRKDPRRPIVVTTLYSDIQLGDATVSGDCGKGLVAHGRIQLL